MTLEKALEKLTPAEVYQKLHDSINAAIPDGVVSDKTERAQLVAAIEEVALDWCRTFSKLPFSR